MLVLQHEKLQLGPGGMMRCSCSTDILLGARLAASSGSKQRQNVSGILKQLQATLACSPHKPVLRCPSTSDWLKTWIFGKSIGLKRLFSSKIHSLRDMASILPSYGSSHRSSAS